MPEIRTREQWGARAPKDINYITMPSPRLWVHHTGDDRQGDAAVRAHQDYHMDVKGWLDIAYSFLIGDDGTIFEGRGAGVAGGHTEGDNYESHAICLLGNFEGHPATADAIDSLVWLAQHGRDAGWWVPTLGGHRDAPGAQTACPGLQLYNQLPAVRNRVAGPTDEDDDMPDHAEFVKWVAEGVQKAIVKGGPSEASMEARVAEGMKTAAAVSMGEDGPAAAQLRARAKEGAAAAILDALDDPAVQEKVRALVTPAPPV